ncbi:tubulin-specific chaperone D [Podospora fimiseda]|uniref:Tubulin-specific chaperone D n=1 Tax=Podospora fimiseda TaxID=252190 RepID=A0AAN7BKS1_9PEZI|nr:tubulin-specific chaperone D [Podospora fimiseda]
MDAPEEDLDIKLQKVSGDLIKDFDSSLPQFLRKSTNSLVRSRVRTREAERLIALLEPFQELPQLLDPFLSKWIPFLGDAWLDYYSPSNSGGNRHGGGDDDDDKSGLLMSIPRVVSKLLYTLCKIRGEKVVVRFLSGEVRVLELVVGTLERNHAKDWEWEERFVALLWVSHLLLVPFDLGTISSFDEEEEEEEEEEKEKKWKGLPGVAKRALKLGVKYLSSPGKERDAARMVLVRLAMRRDMQALGVLSGLVEWALGELSKSVEEEKTAYHYIGVLGFLAGVLGASGDTSDMDQFLGRIFSVVHSAGTTGGEIAGSVLSRKTIIKVVRAVAVLVLRNNKGEQDEESIDMVETTIGFLLESLGDNDTPVRFAASKALSIITLRLDEDMASQVVEAVLESLNKNVLMVKDAKNPDGPQRRDLSAVDPLEWHGLMLTLSHLLYRRSPPAENLADIVQALITGLSFERRSMSGSSSGTNVRDAACFGIWALARRYTTAELLAVPTEALVTGAHIKGSSVLQITATELVAAACLDPSGNIRRGSSAALQELIGRHPDTVEKGIWVVQTVDYHAVALRSRAIKDVALGVTKLSPQYGEAILEELLGWRGVGDVDTASRQAAGTSFGSLTGELGSITSDPVQRLSESISLILRNIKSLQTRQIEERHGLLMSFAAVLDKFPEAAGGEADYTNSSVQQLVRVSVDGLLEILNDSDTKTYRRPELLAEAISQSIVSASPVFQAATSILGDNLQNSPSSLLPGPTLIAENAGGITQLVMALGPKPEPLKRFSALARSNLRKWLARQEEEVLAAASEAAFVMLIFSDQEEREEFIRELANVVRYHPASTRAAVVGGHVSALAMSYSIVSTLTLANEDRRLISDAIIERWKTDPHIDTRVAILKSLTRSDLLKQDTDKFLPLVAEGLDDYTTNARGDVGSLVRLQAIRATKALWQEEPSVSLVTPLFLPILRLAAEKLDRVRTEAQVALSLVLKPEPRKNLVKETFSSKPYFTFLLSLLQPSSSLHLLLFDLPTLSTEKWATSLMAGLVSSADTGNEELVIATRVALTEFCSQSQPNTNLICSALASNLKTFQGIDRVLVPTLEVIAFLFHVGIFATAQDINFKNMCLQVQKAAYKSGNVRKIEACIRVYGGILGEREVVSQKEAEEEAKKRLEALMYHPWPRVKSVVVDELWGLYGGTQGGGGGGGGGEALKGVDWGGAGKDRIKLVLDGLGL